MYFTPSLYLCVFVVCCSDATEAGGGDPHQQVHSDREDAQGDGPAEEDPAQPTKSGG